MAKQNKATIEARKDQLQKLGYKPKLDFFELNDSRIEANEINNWPAKQWNDLLSEIVADIDRTAAKSLTQGEETQLDEMVKVEPVVPEIGKETASLQTLDFGKFEFTDAEFQKHLPTMKSWAQECKELSIKDLADKDGLKAVQAKKSVTRKTRTTLENGRKQKKEYWLRGGQQVDEVAKKFFAEIEEPESHLDAELKKFDDWKTAEETRIENEAKAKLDSRVNALKEAGMSYNEVLGMYCIGQVMSVGVTNIQAWPDGEFERVLIAVKAAKFQMDADEEAERIKDQERLAAEHKEREDFAKAQKELKEKQAEFDLKEKEQKDREAKLLQQRTANREGLLMQVGMKYLAHISAINNAGYHFYDEISDSATLVGMDFIETSDDEKFNLRVEHVKEVISQAKQAEKKKEDEANFRKQRATTRAGQLTNAGLIYTAQVPGIWDPGYHFENAFVEEYVMMKDIYETEDNKWDLAIDRIAKAIAEAKQQAADAAEKEMELQARAGQRENQLKELGIQWRGNLYEYSKPNVEKKAMVTVDEIKDIKPEYWDKFLAGVAGACNEIFEAQQEYEANKAAEETRYQERATQLINLGMSLKPNKYFEKTNDYGDFATITVEQVRKADADNWSLLLQQCRGEVAKVNLSTEQELKKIAEAKEQQRPEIDRAREYINAFSLIPSCMVRSMNIIEILQDFDKVVEEKMKWALTELAELENN